MRREKEVIPERVVGKNKAKKKKRKHNWIDGEKKKR